MKGAHPTVLVFVHSASLGEATAVLEYRTVPSPSVRPPSLPGPSLSLPLFFFFSSTLYPYFQAEHSVIRGSRYSLPVLHGTRVLPSAQTPSPSDNII